MRQSTRHFFKGKWRHGNHQTFIRVMQMSTDSTAEEEKDSRDCRDNDNDDCDDSLCDSR
jgi:hypothetical protein